MPPLQALVALHGLWALAFLPFAVWAARKWPPRRLGLVGYAVIALGLTGLAGLVGRELLTVTPAQQKYSAQRILYVLGTNIDLPVVQVTLAGIALWFAARRRKPRLAEDLRKEVATGHKPIPLPFKVAYTAFIVVLVPNYLNFYGPANLLWLCDIALLLTVAALWLESRFLASMQLVAVLLPSLVWLADFLARLISGHFLTRWTHYMFREDIPATIRALSLYHGWLPFLLLWLAWRLGYDKRGWIAQTLLTWLVLPVCFFFTDPVRALNGVFGPSGERPQTWMAPGLWLALMMIVYPVCVFLPTHLVLRQVFRQASSRPGDHRQVVDVACGNNTSIIE